MREREKELINFNINGYRKGIFRNAAGISSALRIVIFKYFIEFLPIMNFLLQAKKYETYVLLKLFVITY